MCREHPDWRKLLDYAESGAQDSPSVSEHLAACPCCRERLDQARAFVRLLGDARLEDVPESLVQRTLERLGIIGVPAEDRATRDTVGGLKEQIASAAGALTGILAVLVADSRTPTPAMRGATAAEPCLLRYRCPAYEITVSVPMRSAPGRRVILGQVVPLAAESLEPGGWAETPGSSAGPRAELSEFGEFRLETEETGLSEVLIRIGTDLIRVPLPSDLR